MMSLFLILWFVAFVAFLSGHTVAQALFCMAGLLAAAFGLIGEFQDATSKRVRILVAATLYVGVIIFFGCIHLILYANWPDAFTVTQQIKSGRAFDEFNREFPRLYEYNQTIYRLGLMHRDANSVVDETRKVAKLSDNGEVSAKLADDVTMTYGKSYLVGDRVKYEQFFLDFDGPSGRTHLFASSNPLELAFDSNSHFHLLENIEKSKTPEELQKAIKELSDQIAKERDFHQQRMSRRLREEAEWGLIDFCYFSAMTMTTVGFGDIVPNDWRVRLVVIIQAVVGVFFAAFVIDLIWFEGQIATGGKQRGLLGRHRNMWRCVRQQRKADGPN